MQLISVRTNKQGDKTHERCARDAFAALKLSRSKTSAHLLMTTALCVATRQAEVAPSQATGTKQPRKREHDTLTDREAL